MSDNKKIQTRDGYTVGKEGYKPTINKPLQSPEVKSGYQPIVSGDKPVAPPSTK